MLRKLIKFIILLISFITITGISAFLTIHYLIKNQPVVIIPDLIGKEINYSVSQLETMLLTPRIKKSSFNNSIPVNHIISQDPKPGEIVKKGRDVHLVLSRGKKSNTMPSLKNLLLEDARIKILKNGLKLSHKSYIHHDLISKDYVIESSPQAGVPVKTGTKVNILISLGKRPAEYLMPDITGMTIEKATKELSLRKLQVVSIKTKYDSEKSEGTILSQSPAKGIKVLEKEKVLLVLNQKYSPSIISPVIGSRVVSYRIPWGLLRSHIKAELDIYDKTFIIYDNYLPPDEIVDIIVPFDQEAEVRIFKDKILVLKESLPPFKSIGSHTFNLYDNFFEF